MQSEVSVINNSVKFLRRKVFMKAVRILILNAKIMF